MTIAIVCWTLLGGVLAYFALLANQFVRLYYMPSPGIPDEQLPKVGVLLTLRGADPFLEHCLRGVFSLDYPRHEVQVIVDSRQDPAWAVVERVRQELRPANVTVQPLTEFSSTCSLRMCALLQGIASLDKSVEIITWLDADTIPYRRWLRDLVAPFQDPQVGLSHGLRWFNPREGSLGSMVRHIWNAAALLQMCAMKIAWGGSCAIRRSTFESAGLPEIWSRIMFEDTCAANAVLKLGQRVAVAAPVTMMNTESTSLSGCLKFMARQLLNLRLYHRAWLDVLWTGMLTVLIVGANMALPIWAAVSGERFVLIGCGIAWSTFILGLIALLLRTEFAIRKLLTSRGESYSLPSLRMIPAGLLMFFVYGAALLRAMFEKDIAWRGIRYRIDGPFQIARLNYEPFNPGKSSEGATHSV